MTFEPDEKDLRASILALPMPEVWLEFPGPRGPTPPPTTEDAASGSPVKAQLPRAARKILEGIWREACSNSYEVLNTRDVDTKKELASALALANHKATYALVKITIKAPDGRRAISEGEAVELVRYLGKSAWNVVKHAVEAGRQRGNAI